MTIQYVDPPTGARGYLVIDSLVGGIAAGGLRVKEDVTEAQVTALARNMTLKQAAVGIRVGGAKAGLAADPRDPSHKDILKRFMMALKPLFLHMYSCGPDMNTNLTELEEIGRSMGVPCLKIAVARSRGIPDDEFLRRYALFDAMVDGGYTVNQLRSASAANASIAVVLKRLGVAPSDARVAIQGSGNVGGAVAHLLHQQSIRVVSWADDRKTRVDARGLPVPELLAGRELGRLPSAADPQPPSDQVLTADCEVLVLAAVSDALRAADVPRLKCKGIVVGANLALTEEVQRDLHRAGILVVPDLVASVGGSLAVEALYETDPRDGQSILDHVERRASAIVDALLAESAERDLAPRDVLNERLRQPAAR